MVITWESNGNNMGRIWEQYGNHMVIKRESNGNHLGKLIHSSWGSLWESMGTSQLMEDNELQLDTMCEARSTINRVVPRIRYSSGP